MKPILFNTAMVRANMAGLKTNTRRICKPLPPPRGPGEKAVPHKGKDGGNAPLVNATCKLGSKGCWPDGKCRYNGKCSGKIITNADRIRAMSDEELAAFLLNFFTENMDINGIPHDEVTEADKVELLKLLQQPEEASECSK